jgi:hypothetical protein
VVGARDGAERAAPPDRVGRDGAARGVERAWGRLGAARPPLGADRAWGRDGVTRAPDGARLGAARAAAGLRRLEGAEPVTPLRGARLGAERVLGREPGALRVAGPLRAAGVRARSVEDRDGAADGRSLEAAPEGRRLRVGRRDVELGRSDPRTAPDGREPADGAAERVDGRELDAPARGARLPDEAAGVWLARGERRSTEDGRLAGPPRVVLSTDTGVRPTVGVRSRVGVAPARVEGLDVVGALRPTEPDGARVEDVGPTRGALRFTEVTPAGRARTSVTAVRTGVDTTDGRGWALRPVRV